MENNRYFDFCNSSSQRLADLWAIHADLHESLQFICIYRELNNSGDSPNFQAWRAISNAALLSYARAFVSGVRTRINDETMQVLTATELVSHTDLIEIRNKWIAHSVNDLETHQVKLEAVSTASGELVPKRLFCGVTHPISLSDAELTALEKLAEKALGCVSGLMQLEEAYVLSKISEKDLSDLINYPSKFKCPESIRSPRARRKSFHG